MESDSLEFETASRADIELVSLDLFDTLLFRLCGHPSAIFSEVGRHLVASGIFLSVSDFVLARVTAEGQARERSNREEITLEEIYLQMRLSKEEKEFVINQELLFEEQNIFANAGTRNLIKKISSQSKHIVICSDMYLPRDFLHRIFVKELQQEFPLDDFHVSSYDFITKTSGHRFRFLESHYGVPRERILHIGDNRYSDYQIPVSLGLCARLVVPVTFDLTTRLPLNVNPKHYDPKSVKSQYSLEITKDPLARYFYDIGYSVFGPMIYGIIIHLNWLAKKERVTKVLAFMREGALITNSINLVRTKLGGLALGYEVVPFYASRASTFLPRSRTVAPTEWHDEISRRINYSISDFVREFLDGKNQNFEQHSKNSTIRELLVSNADYLSQLAETQHSSFIKYFNSLVSRNDRIALFDLGTGGTINRSLELIFPNTEFVHFLGIASERAYRNGFRSKLNSWLYADKINNGPFAFSQLFSRTPEWVEILMNGTHQSVLRYSDDGSPILDASRSQNDERIFKYLNSAISDYIHATALSEHFLGDAKDGIAYSEFLRHQVTMSIEKILLTPSKQDITYLGSLVHTDNYGSRNSRTILSKENLKLYDNISFEDALYNHKNDVDVTSHIYWPNGLMYWKYSDIFDALHRGAPNANTTIAYCLNCLERLSLLDDNCFFIFGAGELGTSLANFIGQYNYNILGVYDNSVKFITFGGKTYSVKLPDVTLINGHAKIIVASKRFYSEMVGQLLECGVEPNRII